MRTKANKELIMRRALLEGKKLLHMAVLGKRRAVDVNSINQLPQSKGICSKFQREVHRLGLQSGAR
jgi:hypothetical protein